MVNEIDLLQKARTGDREAKNVLVEENVGLVWSVVKRFIGRGYEKEDLFQIGCIGLIKAIDNFNTEFQVKFSTYAVPMITGEIKRFLRDDGMIKVSRTIKENYIKIKRAEEKINQMLGRNATTSELAAATELSIEEIVLALEASSEVESIDRTIFESEGRNVSIADQAVQMEGCQLGQAGKQTDYMMMENGVPVDLEKEKIINHILIEDLLGRLEGKERKLIEYRYFSEMTQMEVAKKLGISQVQVSRLEKKILRNMRKYV